MKNITDRELYKLADDARKKAYSPYSSVTVGAALLTASGKIYEGANIENSAHSPGVCAERVAFFKAINDGERSFLKIAVAGGGCDTGPKKKFPPCGVCLQVMAEFCNKDFEVIIGDGEKKSFAELLPYGFSEEYL